MTLLLPTGRRVAIGPGPCPLLRALDAARELLRVHGQVTVLDAAGAVLCVWVLT
jgi:hypothetical protein